ncbi:MAG: hypothetical protein ACOYT8_03705 [Candidatus Dependentiae bacterium]
MILLFFLIAALIRQPLKGAETDFRTTTALVTTLVTGATIYGIKKLRTPTIIKPSLENLNVVTVVPQQALLPSQTSYSLQEYIARFAQNKATDNDCIKVNNQDGKELYLNVLKGIQETGHQNINIYSRGVALGRNQVNDRAIQAGRQPQSLPPVGGAIIEVYKYMRDNMMHDPCIAFDFPDQRWKNISFTQEPDQECVAFVYDQVAKTLPQKKIIEVGLCRGAGTNVRVEKETPSVTVLESPLISFKDAIHSIGRADVPRVIPFKGPFMYAMARLAFPSYNPEKDNIFENDITVKAPLLLLHLVDDKVVSDEHVMQLLKAVKEKGNEHAYCFVLQDKTNNLRHALMSLAKSTQQVTNAFYAKYQLPHDEQLAKKGEELLHVARQNAQVQSSDEWTITINM